MKLLIVLLLLAVPAVASSSTTGWDGLLNEVKSGVVAKEVRKQDALQKRMVPTRDTGLSGDNAVVEEQINKRHSDSRRIRTVCSPVVAQLRLRATGTATLLTNENTTIQLSNVIQSEIDAFVNSVDLKPPMRDSDKLLDILLESKKIVNNDSNEDYQHLTPLEKIWYSYALVRVALDQMDISVGNRINTETTTGVSESEILLRGGSAYQTAHRLMTEASEKIRVHYPGSTLSCINSGSGIILDGLQKTTYENFEPKIIEYYAPPFNYTFTVAGLQQGIVHLAIQRDSTIMGHYTASIDFELADNGLWIAQFRTASVGAGLSRTRSYIPDIDHTDQVTDDSETVKHLNWYYRTAYLPQCTDGKTCNVIGFFRALTDRGYARAVFETAQPDEAAHKSL